ncbi:MAG: MazG family protein [Actinomycetota bacterium]|nr:MazG family protein [Actinomycetota bacterium]
MSQLDRAVEVMDRLRSPGGCPWDAEQTHASLAKYLVEETYELLEAIETGEIGLLREELGDLLLQVLFHARLSQELPDGEAFGIDEVAADLVDKLVRRHPHVFEPDADPGRTPDQLNELWERQKIAEKGRSSATDGVPVAQPALALSAKLIARAARAGLDPAPAATTDIGDRLFALVRDAVDSGVDPESALRGTARAYRAAILSLEAAGSAKMDP